MLECSIFNCKKEGGVASDQSGYGLINALAVCMTKQAVRLYRFPPSIYIESTMIAFHGFILRHNGSYLCD